MTESANRLLPQLEQLPIADRAELAQFLLHSLDAETDKDVESAWDAELERRVDEIRQGQTTGGPAESVFAMLREKHS
jgi:putative addiction module component (TIGR02574 family)